MLNFRNPYRLIELNSKKDNKKKLMNKTNNQNDESNVGGCLAVIIGIASFALFHYGIAILICLLLVILAYKYNKEKKIQQAAKLQQRKQKLIEKYGAEYGELILYKTVRLGMTKEMVVEAIGNPDSSKKAENAKGITERCEWVLPNKILTSIRGNKYGVFEKHILVEYGDK